MQAIVQERYGPPDLLRLQDVAKPVAGTGQVLVRVRAASLHPDVWHVVRGRPYVLRLMGAGLRRPRNPVPGTDLAGTVQAVGQGVTRFKPGDEVFGECFTGYQWRNGGAFAEYAAVPADTLAPKPARLTFEQAAAVPTSGLLALSGLRDQGRIRTGDRVLVNGAAGGVGTFAVQLAKAFGAHVTAVDVTAKLDLLAAIGADRVLDGTRHDFTRAAERYDVVLDVPGHHPFSAVRQALTADGRYVLIGHDGYGAAGAWLGSVPRFVALMARTPFARQLPPLDFKPPDKRGGMALLAGLIETGELTPVIDRTFPLAEVPAAIRHLEAGGARGKVVISV
jgi:NADPH:quinone reductase-like Zn-dependent oxidoreductase